MPKHDILSISNKVTELAGEHRAKLQHIVRVARIQGINKEIGPIHPKAFTYCPEESWDDATDITCYVLRALRDKGITDVSELLSELGPDYL